MDQRYSTSEQKANPVSAAVIVAAGKGERAGQSHEGPKQYRRIGGIPVIRRTLEAFAEHPEVGPIVVAIHPDDEDLFEAAAGPLLDRVIMVHGGATRQDSTRLALLALRDIAPQKVLIHDGVRPFIDAELISRVIELTTQNCGVLPSLPVSETLKREAADGTIAETVPRSGLHGAQTPQTFPYAPIMQAHERAFQVDRHDFTDDSAIAEWAGISVRLVMGSADNVKLTWAKDIAMADQRLGGGNHRFFPDVRTGTGYDVHAFGQGDGVWLCGVRIDHEQRLVGHSDADVALHALTDALLATIGDGDIGTHFPPSDPQWKGAASKIFVAHAVEKVRAKLGRIANADITLICEAPRVGPHREAMTNALHDMLGISPDRISIKATTNEKLGFIGRSEGIAAFATVSVVYPGELPE